MGRTIVYDSGVKASLDVIFESKSERTGLIFGQHTPQKDVAIYLCTLPPKEDNPKQTDSSDESKEQSEDQKKPTSTAYEDGLELDEAWICQYAKEVTRTLPGGFEILGFFIVAPVDVTNKLQSKLRQVLFAMFRTLERDMELSVCPQVRSKVLLQICPVSKKFVCRTYDVTDQKSTPNPAEWKQFPGSPKWWSVQSQLAIDLKYAVKSEDYSSNMKKHIDSALKPFFKKILGAIHVINGTIRDPSELLDVSTEGKKSKQKQSVTPECCTVDLLIPLEQGEKNLHSNTSECAMMLTFKGTIHSRAFVHSKATVQEAVQAIKQDIIRSIRARCEIHCEDLLVIDEEQQDPIVVYELPKRVFAPLDESGILVCDYQFHGDTASDSITAFKELLNLNLTEEDIEACELSPATSDLIQPEVMEDRLSEFGDTVPPRKNVLFPVASAAIAAVAAGLSYFFLLQES